MEISLYTNVLRRSARFWCVHYSSVVLQKLSHSHKIPYLKWHLPDLVPSFCLLFVGLQSQSQGSITLKIIPAIKEEDRFKESKVNVITFYLNVIGQKR